MKRKKLWLGLLAVLLVLGIACGFYLGSYYPAGEAAKEAAMNAEQLDGALIFLPENPKAGLIFYPGGKVEYSAYAPLMADCAEQGIACILLKMPCNLAVLNPNAAEGWKEQYPQIENWYLGGHSLGGAMAASYLDKHSGEYQGLVLLGAYSTADLSGTALQVLSIYGSEDGVMSQEHYAEDQSNLPASAVEVILQGGCHAGFGDYGPQKGDGIPSIRSEEQQRQTAAYIGSWIS